MTVIVDANILIAFGLADEPLHTQANQILSYPSRRGAERAETRGSKRSSSER